MKRDFIGTYMEPTAEQRCEYAALYQQAKLYLGSRIKRDACDPIGNWDTVRFHNEIRALRAELERNGLDEQALVKDATQKAVRVYSPLHLHALERFRCNAPQNLELAL